MPGRNWAIEGRYVEYCSCDHGCPCETMADPTYGDCMGLVAFRIDKGACDGVPLDGLSFVGTFYFPRALHHGNGVFQPILDQRAAAWCMDRPVGAGKLSGVGGRPLS